MKYLFLDIDGVLNSQTWFDGGGALDGDDARQIDPTAVELLDTIVAESRCRVVISSTWRVAMPLPDIAALLGRRGFSFPRSVVGCTPELPDGRSTEVSSWMEAMQVSRQDIAILDDDTVWGFDDRLVRTTWKHGLQPEHVDRVIEMFEPLKQRTTKRYRTLPPIQWDLDPEQLADKADGKPT